MQGGYRRTRRVKGPPAARRKLERKDRHAARSSTGVRGPISRIACKRAIGFDRESIRRPQSAQSPSERNRNFMFARLRVTCDLSPINYPRYRYSRLPTAFPMSTGRRSVKIRTRIAIASVPLSGSLALFRERCRIPRYRARSGDLEGLPPPLLLLCPAAPESLCSAGAYLVTVDIYVVLGPRSRSGAGRRGGGGGTWAQ